MKVFGYQGRPSLPGEAHYQLYKKGKMIREDGVLLRIFLIICIFALVTPNLAGRIPQQQAISISEAPSNAVDLGASSQKQELALGNTDDIWGAISSWYASLVGVSQWRGAENEDTTWPVLTFGWRTGIAIILGSLGASLSSAGGVGGGGLYVPIFNLLLQFDSKTSAALSNFMIFGGTLANLAWYSFQRHPQLGAKPLIDYDIALILQPNVLLGISVGVICNVMSPGWLVTALLIATLSYITTRSCKGAFRRWNAESAAERIYNGAVGISKDELNGDGGSEKTASLGYPIEGDQFAVETKSLKQPDFVSQQNSRSRPALSSCEEQEQEKGTLLKPLLASQPHNHSQFPATKMAMLALVWLAFLAVQLVRGGQLWNITTCGTAYWLVTSFQLPLAFIMTACTVYYLGSSSTLSEPLSLGDTDAVSSRTLSALAAMALLAGILGGMLGLGGGMMISPLLLEIGVHPQVAASTCSFMVFFSSSMSVVQYWLLGLIPLEYALFSAALCLVFSVAGLGVIQRAILRSGRVSLIVFSVSTVMCISAMLMACFGSLDVWRQFQQGAYMGFQSPC